VLESAVICWPQTGHANLNSLIASAPTIPHNVTRDNAYLQPGRRALDHHRDQG
jgi:hypothetical protein